MYLTIQAQGVKQVAVYIGDSECTDSGGNPCGIAPMGGFDKIHPIDPGGTWFRDSDRMFVAGVSNGQARVRIQPNGKGDTVQVIVLGLNDQGAPMLAKVIRDLKVPASDATSVAMTLDPAGAFDGNPHPSGTYVLRWQDPNAPTDCVLAEHWENGKATDAFIVPEDDGDCDGVPTLDTSGQRNKNECDPYWFHFSDNVAAGEPNCAEGRDQVATHTACLLGGQACVDGSGASGGCVRADSTTCVPGAVCTSACAGVGDTSPLSGCAGVTAGQGTAIDCTVYSGDGSLCQLSDPSAGGLDLAPLFPTSAHTITNLQFAPVDQLYGITSQLQDNKLVIPAPNTQEIDVIGTFAGTMYGYELRWQNPTPIADTTLTQFAVADLEIDNGNHMRLPVRIHYGSCAQANTLAVACSVPPSSDNIVSCGM